MNSFTNFTVIEGTNLWSFGIEKLYDIIKSDLPDYKISYRYVNKGWFEKQTLHQTNETNFISHMNETNGLNQAYPNKNKLALIQSKPRYMYRFTSIAWG